jgi:hypothetical protein
LFQCAKKFSAFGKILESPFGKFFSELSGDNLHEEFKKFDLRTNSRTWKFFRIAFCISYSAAKKEAEDHTSAEPPLLLHYKKHKEVEPFDIPIEFKSEEPDENYDPENSQPITNSAISKRRLAKAHLDILLKKKAEMESSSDDETKKYFRSGSYTGWSEQGGRKTKLNYKFKFSDGKVTGEGNDTTGAFTWSGIFNDRTKKITLFKQYTGGVIVTYEGEKSAVGAIKGIWNIEKVDSGKFSLQKAKKAIIQKRKKVMSRL